MKGALAIPRGKELPCLQRQKDAEKNPSELALLSLSQFTTPGSDPVSYPIFP